MKSKFQFCSSGTKLDIRMDNKHTEQDVEDVNTKRIEYLINEVNKVRPDESPTSALLTAVKRCDNIHVIRLLINYGAKTDILDLDGNSLLDIVLKSNSCLNTKMEVVQFLVQYDINITHKTLIFAVETRCACIVQEILDCIKTQKS